MRKYFNFLKKRWQFLFGLLGLVIGVISILPIIIPDPPPDQCAPIEKEYKSASGELETQTGLVEALRGRLVGKDSAFENAQKRRNRIVRALGAHAIRQHVREIVKTLAEVDQAFREEFTNHYKLYDIHNSRQVDFFWDWLKRANYPDYEARLSLRISMDRNGFNTDGLDYFVVGGRLFNNDIRNMLIGDLNEAISQTTDDEAKLWDLGYDLVHLRNNTGEGLAASLRASMDDIKSDYRALATRLTEAEALQEGASIKLEALKKQLRQMECPVPSS